MNTPTDKFLLHLLKQLGNDTTSLGSCSIGLIAAPFTPARGLTLATLTEATFDGYARKSSQYPTQTDFTSTDNFDYCQGQLCLFQPSGSDTPNTIYGYFQTYSSDSTALACVEPISPPVTLNSTTTTLTVIPRFGLNPTFSFGNGIVGS